MKKPLIGITSSILIMEQGMFPGLERSYVNRDYVQCVERLGGVPVILPVVEDRELIGAQLDMLDGVILSGGYDIDPQFYGEQPINAQNFTYTQIDQYYIKVVHLSQEKKKPLLGICKGCQAINVAYGGNLYQDLAVQKVTSQKHAFTGLRQNPSHTVEISEHARFLGFLPDHVGVNSFHHQSIHQVANGFIPVAHALDGVVEAIEKEEGTAMIGIQWHPEMMANCGNTDMQNIFKKFIGLCGGEEM